MKTAGDGKSGAQGNEDGVDRSTASTTALLERLLPLQSAAVEVRKRGMCCRATSPKYCFDPSVLANGFSPIAATVGNSSGMVAIVLKALLSRVGPLLEDVALSVEFSDPALNLSR